MSVAFAIATRKIGMVYSDGRAWLGNKLIRDDYDRTFDVKTNELHFLGCYTGMLSVQGKPIKEHIEKVVTKHLDNIFKKDLKFSEKELLEKIESDFSKLLSKTTNDENDENNNVVDLLIILPSFNIASFNFKFNTDKKSVECKKDLFQPMDKYARVVIGEDKLHSVIQRHLDGIKNFRYENLRLICNNTLKAAFALSEIIKDGLSYSGGTIFSKFRR